MNDSFDSSLLSGYLDGELDAEEQALVERLLEEQPERRDELQKLRYLQRSLASLPVPPPSRDPVTAVGERIDRRRAVGLASSQHWWLHVTPFALAACLLLAIGWVMFGTQLNRSQMASERTTTSSPTPPAERTEAEATSEAPVGSFSFKSDSIPPDSLSIESTENADRGNRREAVNEASPDEEAAPPVMLGSRPADGLTFEKQESFVLPQSLQAEAEPEPQATPVPRAMQRAPQNSESSPRLREAPADMGLRANRGGASMSLSADDANLPESAPVRFRSDTLLRYEVAQEERSQTERWLAEAAPRGLVALPPEEPAAKGEAQEETETKPQLARQRAKSSLQMRIKSTDVSTVRRYLFFGTPQQRRDLQAALTQHARDSKGNLDVVQLRRSELGVEREMAGGSASSSPANTAAGDDLGAGQMMQPDRQAGGLGGSSSPESTQELNAQEELDQTDDRGDPAVSPEALLIELVPRADP